MADKKKGSGDKKASKKSEPEKAEKAPAKAAEAEVASAKVAEEERDEVPAKKVGGALVADHGHGHGGGGDHGHGPNYKEYFGVFGVLALLTALEVGVTKVPGISHTLMGIALVSMAVTKAAFVGFYYMHLKHETKILKLTVAIPMAAPAFYALVLIVEASWRLTR